MQAVEKRSMTDHAYTIYEWIVSNHKDFIKSAIESYSFGLEPVEEKISAFKNGFLVRKLRVNVLMDQFFIHFPDSISAKKRSEITSEVYRLLVADFENSLPKPVTEVQVDYCPGPWETLEFDIYSKFGTVVCREPEHDNHTIVDPVTEEESRFDIGTNFAIGNKMLLAHAPEMYELLLKLSESNIEAFELVKKMQSFYADMKGYYWARLWNTERGVIKES